MLSIPEVWRPLYLNLIKLIFLLSGFTTISRSRVFHSRPIFRKLENAPVRVQLQHTTFRACRGRPPFLVFYCTTTKNVCQHFFEKILKNFFNPCRRVFCCRIWFFLWSYYKPIQEKFQYVILHKYFKCRFYQCLKAKKSYYQVILLYRYSNIMVHIMHIAQIILYIIYSIGLKLSRKSVGKKWYRICYTIIYK